jgi:hypothetical protein
MRCPIQRNEIVEAVAVERAIVPTQVHLIIRDGRQAARYILVAVYPVVGEDAEYGDERGVRQRGHVVQLIVPLQ